MAELVAEEAKIPDSTRDNKDDTAHPSAEDDEKNASTANKTEEAQKLGTQDFLWGRTIGEGSFARVVHARRKGTKQSYAVKIMDKGHIKSNDKVKYVVQEHHLLKKLGVKSPWVVRLMNSCQDQDNLYMFMELAHGGTLLDVIQRKQEEGHAACTVDEARFYVAEIIAALAFIHSEGVIHRDLKPENILVMESGHMQLTDFGTALDTAKPEQESDFVGTPEYVSPEVLHDQPATAAADLWGIGCILFQLLVGTVPFTAASEWLIFETILDHCSGKSPLAIPETVVHAGAADLVTGLLLEDPVERLNMQSVEEHPFFMGMLDDTDSLLSLPPPWVPGRNIALDSENLVEFSQEWMFDTAEATELEVKELTPPTSKVKETVPFERGRSWQIFGASKSFSFYTDFSNWERFLDDNESIIFCGPTYKRRGLRSRHRQLILTQNSADEASFRLIYVDPEAMEWKGDVPWTAEVPVKVIVLDACHLDIVSPLKNGRAYHFTTVGDAEQCGSKIWANYINKALNDQKAP